MPKLNGRIPKYSLHKASGQGIVHLNGTDCYCGSYHDPASKLEYDRLIKVWLANGRRLELSAEKNQEITINELITHFWEHAQVYYRKADGTVSREVEMYRFALRPLIELFGETSVIEFGPLRLKAVRVKMIEAGWCRNHINHQISRIKSMFRWGTEEEFVPGSVHHALLAVKGLRRGRGEVRESIPVRPVPDQNVDAIKPYVSRQVWALIQLQRFTGARPGELLHLRPMDLDTSAEVWMSRLTEHKTAHHGKTRTIQFGPQAKKVLQEFLDTRPANAYFFSPSEAELERRNEISNSRKTPLSCGNRPGTNRKPRAERSPGSFYTVASYRRAIERACDEAFPPPLDLAQNKIKRGNAERWETKDEWHKRLGAENLKKLQKWRKEHRWHPHQLRHNAATFFRKERGLDAARAILGHRSLAITEVYAELDTGLAVKTIGVLG